jgi:hypothetical protein
MSEKSLTLYEVEDNLQAFLDTEADVPADMQEEFRAALSAAGQAALDKRDACIRAFQVLDSQIEFCKAEKKRIGDRQTVLENGQKRFRRYLASVLQALPEPPMKGKTQPAKKLEGRIGSISLRKGSESIDIVEASKLPTACCDVSVKMAAVTWYAVREIVKDPTIGTALACADMQILPDKAKLKDHLERELPLAIADAFATDEDEKEVVAAALCRQYGARIVQGEPTVVVK